MSLSLLDPKTFFTRLKIRGREDRDIAGKEEEEKQEKELGRELFGEAERKEGKGGERMKVGARGERLRRTSERKEESEGNVQGGKSSDETRTASNTLKG